MPTRLAMTTPHDFHLPTAVCSYGFYALAPHTWDNDRQTLTRPLRAGKGDVHTITIHCPQLRASDSDAQRSAPHAGPEPARAKGRIPGKLLLIVNPTLPRADHAGIKRQVARMLRLDEDLAAFHRLHPAARRRGFGRIFRGPCVFEDVVRTMTCCNTAWANTTTMNRMLCEKVGTDGAFPTPGELARWTPAKLQQATRVGYRAERIVRLARNVEAGRIDLEALDDPTMPTDDLFKALRRIYGMGAYSANNMLQLLGRYDRVPVDSETIALFRKRDNDPGMTGKRAAARADEHYARYAPYQFLAYWYDLWHS